MSLHGSIKLDGTTRGTWEIIRIRPEKTIPDPETICVYRCVYVDTVANRATDFRLNHRYGDGATRLVADMLTHVADLEDSGKLVAVEASESFLGRRLGKGHWSKT